MTPRVSRRPQRLLLVPSSHCTMILNLLLPALVLGFVASQTAITTEEELSSVQANKTIIQSTADYTTLSPANVTSGSYKEEKSQIEDKLLNNQTFTREDNEDFQDQESRSPSRHCQRGQLMKLIQAYCGEYFHKEMATIRAENWCSMDYIIRPYNEMSMCLEHVSDLSNCYYPNPDIQTFCLEIHSSYFHNCSTKGILLMDPPQALVITLTLVPISLIPVLVYLVVCKSKVNH